MIEFEVFEVTFRTSDTATVDILETLETSLTPAMNIEDIEKSPEIGFFNWFFTSGPR